jgi:hypothetical protein
VSRARPKGFALCTNKFLEGKLPPECLLIFRSALAQVLVEIPIHFHILYFHDNNVLFRFIFQHSSTQRFEDNPTHQR